MLTIGDIVNQRIEEIEAILERELTSNEEDQVSDMTDTEFSKYMKNLLKRS